MISGILRHLHKHSRVSRGWGSRGKQVRVSGSGEVWTAGGQLFGGQLFAAPLRIKSAVSKIRVALARGSVGRRSVSSGLEGRKLTYC